LYPRITVPDIIKSAEEWAGKGETRRILLSFLCDPYQPIEQETQITRRAIEILHEHNLNVTILTKAGRRAIRDFDLLTSKDAFATTLTCLRVEDSKVWEPNASEPKERYASLQLAHEKGIETWASLEPVIYPKDTMDWVILTQQFVSHYKVGKLNYADRLPPELGSVVQDINWYVFAKDITALMDRMGVRYYIKTDLAKYLGKPKGFWSYERDTVDAR
jgi:DNA repair photolyase